MSALTHGFGTALIDVPWPTEAGGGKCKRGADRYYKLMKEKEIYALEVRSVLLKDAYVWSWCTVGSLPMALRAFDAWGVRYVSNRVWTKPGSGLGQYGRVAHEHLLLGVVGKPGRPATGVRWPSWRHLPRGAHSAKPAQFREEVAACSPGPHLELFARELTPGWCSLGDALDDVDVATMLLQLRVQFARGVPASDMLYRPA